MPVKTNGESDSRLVGECADHWQTIHTETHDSRPTTCNRPAHVGKLFAQIGFESALPWVGGAVTNRVVFQRLIIFAPPADEQPSVKGVAVVHIAVITVAAGIQHRAI